MTTWVLLRGLVRERRHWGEFGATFGAAVPHARIVMPDLPGNGQLHRERSADRVEAMVEACRAQLLEAGHAPPYHLLALSLGAMVAVEWSVRYPHEVVRAVLINTSMRPFSRFHQRLRWQNYPAILGAALFGGAERRERVILRLTSNRQRADQGLLQRWTALQHACPVTRANALRQLVAAARFRAPRVPPPMPLLVLGSHGDRLVDPACSTRLATAWDTPCSMHPDAGHDLPLDDGAWVAAAVARWCA